MKELIIKDTIGEYLSASKYINWKDNSILSKADEFKLSAADEISLIKTVYEFVRDEIKHSWDVQDKCVTKSATEVLEQEVSWYLLGKGKSSCSVASCMWDTDWNLLSTSHIRRCAGNWILYPCTKCSLYQIIG